MQATKCKILVLPSDPNLGVWFVAFSGDLHLGYQKVTNGRSWIVVESIWKLLNIGTFVKLDKSCLFLRISSSGLIDVGISQHEGTCMSTWCWIDYFMIDFLLMDRGNPAPPENLVLVQNFFHQQNHYSTQYTSWKQNRTQRVYDLNEQSWPANMTSFWEDPSLRKKLIIRRFGPKGSILNSKTWNMSKPPMNSKNASSKTIRASLCEFFRG